VAGAGLAVEERGWGQLAPRTVPQPSSLCGRGQSPAAPAPSVASGREGRGDLKGQFWAWNE